MVFWESKLIPDTGLRGRSRSRSRPGQRATRVLLFLRSELPFIARLMPNSRERSRARPGSTRSVGPAGSDQLEAGTQTPGTEEPRGQGSREPARAGSGGTSCLELRTALGGSVSCPPPSILRTEVPCTELRCKGTSVFFPLCPAGGGAVVTLQAANSRWTKESQARNRKPRTHVSRAPSRDRKTRQGSGWWATAESAHQPPRECERGGRQQQPQCLGG